MCVCMWGCKGVCECRGDLCVCVWGGLPIVAWRIWEGSTCCLGTTRSTEIWHVEELFHSKSAYTTLYTILDPR